MARTKLPDKARVTIGLKVAEAEAMQIDQVLTRPEFAGWTRAEWCREIVRTALRYYAADPPPPDPGRARAPARPAAAEPVPPSPPPPAPASPPVPASPSVPASSPVPAESQESPAGCPHPADARDYERGACGACGAILWD